MNSYALEIERELKQQLTSKSRLSSSEENLLDRLNGRQPTLDICGNLFFVNWMRQCLERKGAPLETISFEQLDEFIGNDPKVCTIPYDREKGVIIDYCNLTEMPKNVAFVAFPSPAGLDVVGFCRSGWADLREVLKEQNQVQHHRAKLVPSRNQWLRSVVATNRRDRDLPPLKERKRNKGFRR
jgi:hypothetical protein